MQRSPQTNYLKYNPNRLAILCPISRSPLRNFQTKRRVSRASQASTCSTSAFSDTKQQSNKLSAFVSNHKSKLPKNLLLAVPYAVLSNFISKTTEEQRFKTILRIPNFPKAPFGVHRKTNSQCLDYKEILVPEVPYGVYIKRIRALKQACKRIPVKPKQTIRTSHTRCHSTHS